MSVHPHRHHPEQRTQLPPELRPLVTGRPATEWQFTAPLGGPLAIAAGADIKVVQPCSATRTQP